MTYTSLGLLALQVIIIGESHRSQAILSMRLPVHILIQAYLWNSNLKPAYGVSMKALKS